MVTVVKLPGTIGKDGDIGYWCGFVLDCRFKLSTIPAGVNSVPLSAFRGHATEGIFLFSGSLPRRKGRAKKPFPNSGGTHEKVFSHFVRSFGSRVSGRV